MEKKTILELEGFEIPVKQGFYKQPALYLNVETKTLYGEYPLTVTEEEMKAFCQDKIQAVAGYLDFTKQWIFNNPFTFENGEIEYILGDYYQLNINIAPGRRQKIEMDKKNGRINLTVRREENVYDYLDKYFRSLLKEYIHGILSELEDELKVKSVGFQIRKLKDAYGCCNKEGFLKFDPILYRKSKEAVKVVVLHELCHVKEFNHKGEFFDLMGKIMPDWRKINTELTKVFPEKVFR